MTSTSVLAFLTVLSMTIGEGKEPFVLAKEAYEASKKNLTSGTGDGILEIYSEKPEESELHLDKKARCKVYFQGDKFHIRLNFEKHNKDIGVSRIIICDGKTILSSFVCQRVRPLGVKADMYEVDKGYAPNSMSLAGFPFYPRKLQDQVMRVDLLVENISKIKLDWERNKLGGFTATSKNGNNVSKFDCFPENGFNVSSFTVSDGGTELLQDQRASWEQKNGIWYVKKVSRAFNWKNGSQSKTVFAYSNFEINPKVDSSLFKFDALELPEGAMVSDNNPRGGPPAYYVRPAGQNDLKKVDDLLQEMKSRTTTQQPGVSRKKKGSS